MTPLETRLTNALAADVARFDAFDAGGEMLPPDLQRMEHDLLPVRPPSRSPRGHRRRSMAGVVAAALVCLAVAAIAIRRNDDSSGSDSGPDSTTTVSTVSTVSTTATIASLGLEQPLVETAISGVQDVAKPGSAHAFAVLGHPDLLIWTTLMPNALTGAVEEVQCVSEAGGSGCGPTSIPGQFGQTSSIDNRVATDDLFTWSNLPSRVAIVRYDDGVVQLWQRPVAGLAVFRVDPNHPHPSISAFDTTGAALPYSFWTPNPALAPATETTDASVSSQPATPAASSENFGELNTLTQSSVRDCLTSHGASWSVANVPTFAADVDSVAIWNACVVEVNAVVAARRAELDSGS